MFSKHGLSAAGDELVFSLSGITHFGFEVLLALGSASAVGVGFDISDDGGTTWTDLTEKLSDTMLGNESITATVALSSDGTTKYRFARPSVFGSVGMDFAEALELLFATHVRMKLASITGDAGDTTLVVKYLAFNRDLRR